MDAERDNLNKGKTGPEVKTLITLFATQNNISNAVLNEKAKKLSDGKKTFSGLNKDHLISLYLDLKYGGAAPAPAPVPITAPPPVAVPVSAPAPVQAPLSCLEMPCEDDKQCYVEDGTCHTEPVESQTKSHKLVHKGKTYYGSISTLTNVAAILKVDPSKIEAYKGKKQTPEKVTKKKTPSPKKVPQKQEVIVIDLDDEEPSPPPPPKKTQKVTQVTKAPSPVKKKTPEKIVLAEQAREIVSEKMKEVETVKRVTPPRKSPPSAVEQRTAQKIVAEAATAAQVAAPVGGLEEEMEEYVAPRREPAVPPPAPPMVRRIEKPAAEEEPPMVLAETLARVTAEKPLSREQLEIVAKIRKCIGI